MIDGPASVAPVANDSHLDRITAAGVMRVSGIHNSISFNEITVLNKLSHMQIFGSFAVSTLSN